jgi:hypothetical protein
MPDVTLTCENCGDQMTVTAWRAANQPPRFCSRECRYGRKNPQKRIDLFWSRVDQSAGPDGCWPWTGCRYNAGYGSFHWRHKMRGTNRVAWEIANGQQAPDDRDVMHSCDSPLCCNPRHLRLGTTAENMADMRRKGRARSKGILTESAVLALRCNPPAEAELPAVAAQHGVSLAALKRAIKGESWKYLSTSANRSNA